MMIATPRFVYVEAAVKQSAAVLQSENPASVEAFELKDPAVQTEPVDHLLTDKKMAKADAKGWRDSLSEAAHGVGDPVANTIDRTKANAHSTADAAINAAARAGKTVNNVANDRTLHAGGVGVGEKIVNDVQRVLGGATGRAADVKDAAHAAAADTAAAAADKAKATKVTAADKVQSAKDTAAKKSSRHSSQGERCQGCCSRPGERR
jgi:hypothetical protein